MRGERIPVGKRIINDPDFPPINPADYSEANADHLMHLWDNIGSGLYIEDAAILDRHVAHLFAREQVSPNLTVEVLAGAAYFGPSDVVTFAGGNSAVFTAPATDPRIDILTLKDDGTLETFTGAEAAVPVAPTFPSNNIPLAQIYNVVGQTRIRDFDTQEVGQGYIQYDLRPFIVNPVGANSMPKIGIVDRVQQNNTTNAFNTVLDFSGSGRLRLVNVKRTGGSSPGGSAALRITIDGTTAETMSIDPTLGVGQSQVLKMAVSDSANKFKLTTPGAAEDPGVLQDVFFKSELKVEINSDSFDSTTTVEYEGE